MEGRKSHLLLGPRLLPSLPGCPGWVLGSDGSGGREAIAGRLWPRVPLAGKVTCELQAEL